MASHVVNVMYVLKHQISKCPSTGATICSVGLATLVKGKPPDKQPISEAKLHEV
jgi:hypothetical protein